MTASALGMMFTSKIERTREEQKELCHPSAPSLGKPKAFTEAFR